MSLFVNQRNLHHFGKNELIRIMMMSHDDPLIYHDSIRHLLCLWLMTMTSGSVCSPFPFNGLPHRFKARVKLLVASLRKSQCGVPRWRIITDCDYNPYNFLPIVTRLLVDVFFKWFFLGWWRHITQTPRWVFCCPFFLKGFPIHSRVVNRQMLQDQVFHRLPKECMKESDDKFLDVGILVIFRREATLWQARSFFQHDATTRGWHLKRVQVNNDLIWAFLKSGWSKYTKRRHS